jgi:protein-disulfide isomerase
MIQYARLGGLSEDKAKACASDTKLQDAIVAERTEAGTKYNIDATPTFVVNDGAEIIKGAQSVDTFAATFDRLLAAKKK